jgi:ATP-binding cassette subfamily B protein
MSVATVKQALAPDDAPEHKRLDRGLIARLWGYMHPYRGWVWLTLAISLAIMALKVAQPVLVRSIIDDKIAARDVAGIARLSALLLLVILTTAAAQIAFDYIATWFGQRAMDNLRRQLIRQIMRQDVVFFDRNPIGRLVTRMTSDVGTLDELLSTGMVSVLGEVLILVGVLGAMAFYNLRLTLVVLAAVPAIYLVVRFFRRHVRFWYLETRRSLATMNAFLQENVSGMRAVQAFGRQARNLAQFAHLNDDYRVANIQTIFGFAVFFPAMNLISALVVTGVIWEGGLQLLHLRALGGQGFAFGQLFFFVQCTQMLFQPLRDLSEQYNLLQSAMASSERIFNLLDQEPGVVAPPGAAPASGLREGIRLETVVFSYLPGRPVLRGVSLEIPRGKTVAIVGATGAGKSTLINLLTRFYDVDSGRITVDGVDLREMDLTSLRRMFAVVLQEVFLFSGTIAENLHVGNPTLGDAELWRVLEEVRAAEFVRRLPGGLDAHVSERGGSFSTGQKQLLAFARALASDPSVLILDEATANVDTETEGHIQQATERLLEGRSALVVAHRLSTIRRADQIVVMHHGQVHERGTHEELLARDGLYRRLCELQYGGQAA